VAAPSESIESEVGWSHFTHGADVGVCGRGATPEAAFAEAALALTAIVTDTEVLPKVRIEVACARPDLELLFVDWLDAVIYEMAVRRMVFGRFAVNIEGAALSGELWGEPVDVARHAPACEPKGATLTGLKVARDAGGMWTARCVVDV